jgi:hypothetical protein
MTKLLKYSAVSLLLAAGTLGVATPALAAHVGPAGYVSFWDGCPVGYCGAAWPIPQSQLGQGVCHSVPSGSNDRFTAFDNNTSRNIVVYTAGGCTGSVATLYAGTMTGQMGSPFNNSISSYK